MTKRKNLTRNRLKGIENVEIITIIIRIMFKYLFEYLEKIKKRQKKIRVTIW